MIGNHGVKHADGSDRHYQQRRGIHTAPAPCTMTSVGDDMRLL
jgi:hypothetical protein